MTIVQDILARPYKRVVERGEDGVYTASLVELPGAISEGDSYEEALRNLDEGLADLIGVMLEDGRPIPEPVSQQAFSGRLQIRLTPSLHARATMFAQMEGVSLNRVLSDAVASYVGFGTRQMASAGAGDSGRAARETPGVYRTAGATATDSPPARAARAKTAARKTTAKKASDASRTAGTRPAKPPSTARPRAK